MAKRRSEELTELDVQYQHQTLEAVCFRVHELGRDYWVPKSLLDGWDDDEAVTVRGDYITLTVDAAWAMQKGLI